MIVVPGTSPILKQVCENVTDVKEAVDIVRTLEKELRNYKNAIGLSAPQIGIPKAVSIIRLYDIEIDLINPSMLSKEEPFIHNGEGCVSYPGRIWNVPRFKLIRMINHAIWPPKKAIVSVKNPEPALVRQPVAFQYGLPADNYGGIVMVAIQHEYDHLQGVTLPDKPGAVEVQQVVQEPIKRDAAKVGRNDPCPCGSGKKYKKCCGG